MGSKRLIDKKTLCERHPAFKGKKYTLEWLIRKRAIPIVRVGGRRIYFDEAEIDRWIEEHKIPAHNGRGRSK